MVCLLVTLDCECESDNEVDRAWRLMFFVQALIQTG